MISNDIGAEKQLRFLFHSKCYWAKLWAFNGLSIEVNHPNLKYLEVTAKAKPIKTRAENLLNFYDNSTTHPSTAATTLTIRDDAFFKVNLQSAKFQTDVLLGTRLD